MLDTPLPKGSQLPNAYWSDFRLLIGLDAFIQNGVPLSPTYLLKAKGERVDAILAAALNQPAATSKKWLNAITFAHGSLGKFSVLAGVAYDASTLPENCDASEEKLFDAIEYLIEQKVSLKSADILNYYPTGPIKANLDGLFQCEMTGPMLWRLAREYGHRWDKAVLIVRQEQRRERKLQTLLFRPHHLQALSELRAEGTLLDFESRIPKGYSASEAAIYRDLAQLVLASTETLTIGYLVTFVQGSSLLDTAAASLHVLRFLDTF